MSANKALDCLVVCVARMREEAKRMNFVDSDAWYDLGMDDIVAATAQAVRAQEALER